jgi:ribonuclease HII
MILPTFDKEREILNAGYQYVVGIDEVGRGPWAGPVVAGAVVLDLSCVLVELVRDSKKMSEKQRITADEEIRGNCLGYGIGEVSNIEIDETDLIEATKGAMRQAFDQAIEGLGGMGKIFVLVDGYFSGGLNLGHDEECVTSGDQHHYSIAAASIIAKVHRDNLMNQLDLVYPDYGFAKHKGYGTKQHQEALGKYGICEIHRKSFKPVAKYV